MNTSLQNILTLAQQSASLSDDQKKSIADWIKEADKTITIAEFKLDRTEKVKRTTAILLEETIEELEQKRKAIEESNAALQTSLEELKAAQAQLIQSEKMASLGELTAGIAHEIQNPLNFVNNFSELSAELIDEMLAELNKGNAEEVKMISNDIKQNLEKINHHGKRADVIVKGMLQHSRSSDGKKELTDINVLCDEYLRLSYHGLRAKDKTFNVGIRTSFDEVIGKVNVVPQDIGRVILNLLTNAFYAAAERKKTAGEGFEPNITLSTKRTGDKISITVADNGNGIPEKVLDKIFQPFFTTKPTGQGTGLGLSLSYDIIKSHGGEIKVKTHPAGEAGGPAETAAQAENDKGGTVFIITLPG